MTFIVRNLKALKLNKNFASTFYDFAVLHYTIEPLPNIFGKMSLFAVNAGELMQSFIPFMEWNGVK